MMIVRTVRQQLWTWNDQVTHWLKVSVLPK